MEKPASVKGVALWQYEPQHPTDLHVDKGERVKILYRNGELAFVENSKQKQGFVPLGYCSLRRRSGSLSDLAADTARKISNSEVKLNGGIEKGHRLAVTPDTTRRTRSVSDKDSSQAANNSGTMSKGSYNARAAENKGNKKTDKGILNNAAKKLIKVFSSTRPSKSKAKSKNGLTEHKPLPDWLRELNFDNNNADYSSTSSDSSDEEEDYRYHHQRRRRDSKRESESDTSAPRHGSFSSAHSDATVEHKHKVIPDNLKANNKFKREYTSQDITTGYANVRKLKTSSVLGRSGIARSRSFNLDSRPRCSFGTLRRPRDLSEESVREQEDEQSYVMPSTKLVQTSTTRERAGSDTLTFDNRTDNPVQSFTPKERVDVDKFSFDNRTDNLVQTRERVVTDKLSFDSRPDTNVMIVTQDFVTVDGKDLDALAGQRVRVLNRNDEKWWLCEAEDGRGGFVPRHHLIPAYDFSVNNMQNHEDGGLLNGLVNGHDESRDYSLRNKTSSVKLARISPMAREPSSNQTTCMIGDHAALKFTNGDMIDYKSYGERDSKHTANCDQEELKYGINGFRRDMIHEDDCAECKLEQSINLKYSQTEKEFVIENVMAKEKQIYGMKENANFRSFQIDYEDCIPEEDEHQFSEKLINSNNEKYFDSTAINGKETKSLPSYNEIMELRTELDLMSVNNGNSPAANTVYKISKHKETGDTNLIERLLQEWRDEQKRSGDEQLATDRRSSSDSLATTDSAENAPRVLRRRNSMNRRARFQNSEDSTKTATIVNTAADKPVETKQDKLLATWL